MHIQVIRRSVSKPLTAASIVSLYILPLLFYLPHIFVFSLYILPHLFISLIYLYFLCHICFWIYCSLKVCLFFVHFHFILIIPDLLHCMFLILIIPDLLHCMFLLFVLSSSPISFTFAFFLLYFHSFIAVH